MRPRHRSARLFRAASAAGLAVLLFAGDARAQSPAAPSPDALQHFGLSAGLAASGYGLAALGTESPPARLALAFGGALALGVGKELYDATGAGDPSGEDLAWDALGAATGALVAWAVDALLVAP